MPTKEALPNSLPYLTRNVIRGVTHLGTLNWKPIFCANCGAPGGLVPEQHCTFAFYLCNKCEPSWAPLEGTYSVPDDQFWSDIKELPCSSTKP